MTPPDEGPSLGELSRQVRDVFARFEGLARRLEDGQFVRTDLYILYRESVNGALAILQERMKAFESNKIDKADLDVLEKRIAQLEDDKKWLVRLVLGFIVLGVLGAVFAISGGSTP